MTRTYHLDTIPKGVLGDSSKILEEVMELQDSEKQQCRIMALLEVSDILGAIEQYVKKHYPGITMEDIKNMSDITQRSFKG